MGSKEQDKFNPIVNIRGKRAEATIPEEQDLLLTREIQNMILDFIKPYMEANVGSILIIDIEQLAKEIVAKALKGKEAEISKAREDGYQAGQQHSIGTDSKLVEQAKREERERIFKRIDEMQVAGYFDYEVFRELDKLRQALKEGEL